MQHVRIVAVGKLKESWLREGCAEYVKRLSSSIRLHIHEVADEPASERLSSKNLQQLMHREGERIIKSVPSAAYVIALTLQGKGYDSVQFAAHLAKLARSEKGHLCFIIGGSSGLGENVLQIAGEQLCLSAMTFPHQLCRLILLEQLYRAFSIQNGSAYHK
jgi:23S rRNA (pseudouridine1915-N3)-methyltransferase